MQTPLSPEIFWLTATALMTALLWMPYIVNQILSMGLWAAVSNSDSAAVVRSPWAKRAASAHSNAVENLVVFAPLVLAVQVTGLGSDATAMACLIYFLARAAHYVVYVFAVPLLRTLLFAVGVGCQVTLAATLLGWT